MAPSDSRGTNSEPKSAAMMMAKPSDPTASAEDHRPMPHGRARGPERIASAPSRTIQGSRSFTCRGSSKLASTGINVSDRTSEPTRAKITVSAIGRNILPSTPCKVRIGK